MPAWSRGHLARPVASEPVQLISFLDVFGRDVDFDVHGGSLPLRRQRGHRFSVRNDGDGEAVIEGGDDRQADPVDGDQSPFRPRSASLPGPCECEGRARGRRCSPTASTWPCTRCPPRRSMRRTGRSRFTGLPGSSSPRLVRLKVSRRHVGPPPSGRRGRSRQRSGSSR